jgi:hypothetical protein
MSAVANIYLNTSIQYMAHNIVTKEPALTVIISGTFVSK